MEEGQRPASTPEPAAPPPAAGESLAERRARRAAVSRRSTVGRAAKWVLAVGILQVLCGAVFGMMNSRDADKALQTLAKFDADEVVELEDGTQKTAAELRTDVERERIAGFAIPIGVGVAMLALYVWARRSPLPAMVSALCLYLLVVGVSGVIDPKTLAQGVIVKVFFITALIAGIKAALAEREVAAAVAE